jgi:hypothetical protein
MAGKQCCDTTGTLTIGSFTNTDILQIFSRSSRQVDEEKTLCIYKYDSEVHEKRTKTPTTFLSR